MHFLFWVIFDAKLSIPLKPKDIINNNDFGNKYIINLEWLKKRANDDKDYAVVATLFTCGESLVYAVHGFCYNLLYFIINYVKNPCILIVKLIANCYIFC
jgi:hypothetical protein